ncbi:MAG: transposase [Acidobacteriia bacterium]|nr:transposase [Terriglobia bacterium]
MPRIARPIIPGIAHHVTQRGNRCENIFFEEADRQRYMQLLLEYSSRDGMKILAYCLMTNHVHLVCLPERAQTFGSVLRPLDLRYTQHINRTLGLTGRLWQGRPFSCALDDEHLKAAVRYVERNPVRARMVRKAERYPWSSAAAHCGLREDPLLSPLQGWVPVGTEDWSAWLAEKEDEEMLATIRLHTRAGRPVGGERFVSALESRLGRRLQARSIGRPRNEKTSARN